MIRPILTVAFAFSSVAVCLFACSGSTADNPSSFDASTFDAGLPDPGDPDAPPLFGDGSTNQVPGAGSPEYKCYTASTKSACRNCCHNLYPDGRRVFTGAIDECVCQPSKCGQQCAATFCNIPQKAPPANSDCSRCVAAAQSSVGDAAAPEGDAGSTARDAAGGGKYPEKGIVYCLSYANALCRDSTECMQAEACKVNSACSSKQ